MRSDELIPLASGLKPTLRQMMILVIWAGFVSAGLRFMLSWGFFAQSVDQICLNLALLMIFPWFLACFLLYLLDRRGPVRAWYIEGCQACGGVLASATLVCMDLVCYVLTGRPTLLFPFAPVVGLMILCACTIHLRTLWPNRCLFCGSQAVIAAVTTLGNRPNYRSKPQNWCAACGRYDAPEEGKPWWLDEDLADTNEFLLPESDANT